MYSTDISKIGYLVSQSKQIQCTKTIADHTLGVSDVAINRLKKNEFATSSFDHSINIYDTEKIKLINSLKGHSAGVWTLDYKLNSSILASGGNDHLIILWDDKYNKISELKGHNETVYDVKFSQNGNLMASCSQGLLCLWDIRSTTKPLSKIKGIENYVIS